MNNALRWGIKNIGDRAVRVINKNELGFRAKKNEISRELYHLQKHHMNITSVLSHHITNNMTHTKLRCKCKYERKMN